jgi:hypothetical protein
MKLKSMRIEELNPIGTSVKASFTADQADFEDFSSIYGAAFLANLTAKLLALDGIHSTRFHIKQIEQLTIKILLIILGIRPKMRKLERYIDLAVNVTGMNRKQFGVIEVGKQIKRKDVEALLRALFNLYENVELHSTALEAVGFTAAKFLEMKDMRTQLKKHSDEQTEKMQDKVRAVADNMDLFVEVETIILDIMKTGKALYQYEHKERLPEYTLSTKLDQIRQEKSAEQKEIEEIESSCAVFVNYEDEDGEVLADVTTTVVEYELVVQSEDDGVSYFEKVLTEPYAKVTIKSELDGYVTDLQNEVALEVGGEVEITVVLRKVV